MKLVVQEQHQNRRSLSPSSTGRPNTPRSRKTRTAASPTSVVSSASSFLPVSSPATTDTTTDTTVTTTQEGASKQNVLGPHCWQSAMTLRILGTAGVTHNKADVSTDTTTDVSSIDTAVAAEDDDNGRQVQELEAQVRRLQLQVQRATRGKQHIIANLQTHKRVSEDTQSQLESAQLRIQLEQKQNATLWGQVHTLQQDLEHATLQQHLLRDQIRALQANQVTLQTAKQEAEQAARDAKRDEDELQELLRWYRQLSLYTGYHKWAKEIRAGEAALKAQQQQRAGSSE